MSLIDAFQADTDQAIGLMLSSPMPPPPKIQKRSWWQDLPDAVGRSLGSAIPAAVAEGAAGLLEIGTAAVRTADRSRRAPNRQAFESKLGQPVSGETELSRSLRNAAESFRPDPLTAGTAEQIVFGATKGIAKAVGYTMAAGPLAGAAAFGMDEGLTALEDLQRKGVDDKTATQAAGLIGLTSGAGVLIPFAGSTIPKTAALAVLSGPGAFIAQQAAVSDLLKRADYAKIAEQYDPFDLTGLSVATGLAAVFAGKHAATLMKAAKPVPVPPRVEPGLAPEAPAKTPEAVTPAPEAATPPEVVDAAMVHNLTLQQDRLDPVRMQAVERQYEADIAARLPEVEPFDQYAARALAEQPVAKEARAGKDDFLGFLRGIGGVKYSQLFDITGERGVRANRGAVFKKTGREIDEVAELAVEAGYLSPDALRAADDNGGTRAVAALIDRAMKGERITPFADGFGERVRLAAEQGRTDAAETRLRFLGIEPFAAKGDAAVMERYLEEHGVRLMNQRVAEVAEDLRPAAGDIVRNVGLTEDMIDLPGKLAIAGRLDYAATARAAAEATDAVDFLARIEEILGNGPYRGKADGSGPSAAADAGMGPGDGEAGPAGTATAAQEVARIAGAAGKADPEPSIYRTTVAELAPRLLGREPGQVIAELKQEGKLSPVANNAVVGLADSGGDLARVRDLIAHAEALAAQAPGRAPGDVMADAVDRVRAGEPAPTPKVVPIAAESLFPDLPVRVTEDGQVVTAKAEIEAVRREAIEGTADTLGARDADLLQVAADCFLRGV